MTTTGHLQALLDADEHDYAIDTAGAPGSHHACLYCRTCATRADGWPTFYGNTLALAVRAHRQHVAATDLAQNIAGGGSDLFDGGTA